MPIIIWRQPVDLRKSATQATPAQVTPAQGTPLISDQRTGRSPKAGEIPLTEEIGLRFPKPAITTEGGGTATKSAISAEWRHTIFRRGRQRDVLLHDAQNQLRPIRDGELAVQAPDVGVDRAQGDAEVVGDGGFGLVVKRAEHNLKFPRGELEVGGDFIPHLGGEHG